jgi:hypothetical protein
MKNKSREVAKKSSRKNNEKAEKNNVFKQWKEVKQLTFRATAIVNPSNTESFKICEYCTTYYNNTKDTECSHFILNSIFELLYASE